MEHPSHPCAKHDVIITEIGIQRSHNLPVTLFIHQLRLFILLVLTTKHRPIHEFQLLYDLAIIIAYFFHHFPCVEIIPRELIDAAELHMLEHQFKHVFTLRRVQVVLHHGV